jgi:hypothetical protein
MSKKNLVIVGAVVFAAVLAAVVIGNLVTKNVAQPLVDKGVAISDERAAWDALEKSMTYNDRYQIYSHEVVSKDEYFSNHGSINVPWKNQDNYTVYCFKILVTGRGSDGQGYTYYSSWQSPDDVNWHNVLSGSSSP